MFNRLGVLVACAGLVAAAALPARADLVDLTPGPGSSGVLNGATFEFYGQQPAGTGVFEPFVRIQNDGIEQGYNTSNDTLPFDEKPGPWTHAVLMSDLLPVNVGGADYLQFFLDINEPAAPNMRLLSLDEIKIFTSPIGSQNTTDLNALGTLRYDLDAGGGSDNWILMDATLSSGSGESDMRALIPLSAFAGAAPTDYMIFYSKFGVMEQANADANGGFEEWKGTQIPEPMSATLLLLGAAGLRGRRSRRARGC